MRFETPEAPSVSVVVLGWRDAPRLPDCLGSLAQHHTEHPFEVVVALNDPIPGLPARLHEAFEGVEIIALPVNTGYAGGCNRAVARARGTSVVLLNDDCTVTGGWLDALVSVVEARPEVGAVGSRQVAPDGSVLEAGSILWRDGTVTQLGPGLPADMPALAESRPVDYCSGASLLVRKHTWDAVGGLDTAFFPAYYEDVDLCLKIAARRELVWLEPASVVVHAQGSSTAFPYRRFLSARNRRILLERWQAELASREPRPAQENVATLGRVVARTTERIELQRRAIREPTVAPGAGPVGPGSEVPGPDPRAPDAGAAATGDRAGGGHDVGAPDVEGLLRAELAVRREYEPTIEHELEEASAALAAATLRVAELQAELGGVRAELDGTRTLVAQLQDHVERLEAARRQAVDEVAFLRSRPGYQLVDRANRAISRVPGARRVARAIVHGLQRGGS